MEKKSLSLKLAVKMLANFATQFFLGSIYRFSATESREVSLDGNVYDFLVNFSSIDKSDI